MSKWETVRLGDAFPYIRNGASIKQERSASGYPITRIETISNSCINRAKMGYANIMSIDEYYGYILQDDDILMSHINSVAHLGRVARYIRQNGEVIIHGMNLLNLRADKNKVDSLFAYYFFSSYTFKKQLPNITKNSVNQSSFNITALKELDFPLPPLPIQQQIADVLDRTAALIEKRKAQIAKQDVLVKSQFIEMFGDPVTNPMGWEIKRLGNIITHANNGIARRGNDENGVIVLRLVELQDGYIDYSKPNRICLDDAEKRRYLLNEGDFIFARVNGNPTYVGRCAVYNDIGEPVYHNDHIIRVRFDSERLDGFFASQLLNSQYGKGEMKDKIKTSAGQYTINQAGIGAIMVPIPPLRLQNRFADFVRATDKSKLEMLRGLDKLELLYKSLMQKYFSGDMEGMYDRS